MSHTNLYEFNLPGERQILSPRFVWFFFFLNTYGFYCIYLFVTAIGYGGISSRPFSMFYRLVAFIVSIYVIASITFVGRKWNNLSGLSLPLYMFWMLYSTRIVFDTVVFRDYELFRLPLDYWMYAFGIVLIPMTSFAWKLNMQQEKQGFSGLYAAAFMFCLLFVVFFRNSFDEGEGYRTAAQQNEGEFVHAIAIGYGGATTALLAFWAFLQKRGNYAVNMIAFTVGMYLMILSGTRGAALSVSVTALIIILTTKDTSRIFHGLIVAIVISFALILFAGESATDRLINLTQEIKNRDIEAGAGRGEIWAKAVDGFMEHPILGCSLELKTIGYYPHNIVLEAFHSTGILGGLLMIYLVLRGIYDAYLILKYRPEMGWISILFFRGLGEALVSGAVYILPLFWIALVLARANCPSQKNMFVYR